MNSRKIFHRLITLLLGIMVLAGCNSLALKPDLASTQLSSSPIPPMSTPNRESVSTPALTGYAFPGAIDPAKRYLFYLHGKIIENQGIHAVSPEYGAYEYETILDKLASFGFVVISEPREKNTNPVGYAEKVVGQIRQLLNADVPPYNITVVGASVGAGIAANVSSLLKNESVNFILLGYCSPEEIAEFKQNHMSLYGNVLAIYDSVDALAGSCQELFTLSAGKGLTRHSEIELHIGTGHGILYKPLDEWVSPTVQWALELQ
jgi:hypothetical protein